MGKIDGDFEPGGDDETPLQVKLNGVATIIGKIGLAFATLTFIVLLISSEGLPLAVTLSLAFAMKKLMDDKALVRHLSACETMGSAGCICTDKTGTLTTNHMATLSDKVINSLLQCIFHNSGSEVVRGKDGKSTILGTPTETALLEFGLDLEGVIGSTHHRDGTKLKVEPFNSVKKKMSVLVSLHDGVTRAFCKDPVRPGVREAVQICTEAGVKVRMVTGDNINTAKAIAKECGILTEGGLAIEGSEFRSRDLEEMNELIPKLQVMARSLPLDKHTLVTNLRRMGEVVAVTGDGTNDAPALHEADIGLAMGIAGTEFYKQLASYDFSSVSFETVKYTSILSNHLSHFGIDVFYYGLVAKENADVIVLDDNFTTIINVARWGRAVYINIQKFVQFQLTVNIVALIINFVSSCITGDAPLTAVQLLWVNMIMDTLGALALATEPPNDEMMKRPPTGRGEAFITKTMWRNIIGQSIYQLVVLGVLMFDGKNLLGLSGSNASIILNTFIFNTFVFCQGRKLDKILGKDFLSLDHSEELMFRANGHWD
ncbi:hypothetical protein HPP92_012123 [Vanilla planifolia]|uniref:P-type Cu(+) transporter n=1 Tax=Vanilla planifolia TaxID=51239 RepID=A0A835R431_VANPL|nr:hypothetical protein HPP92_012123 [Vanilla planifolia]